MFQLFSHTNIQNRKEKIKLNKTEKSLTLDKFDLKPFIHDD